MIMKFLEFVVFNLKIFKKINLNSIHLKLNILFHGVGVHGQISGKNLENIILIKLLFQNI